MTVRIALWWRPVALSTFLRVARLYVIRPALSEVTGEAAPAVVLAVISTLVQFQHSMLANVSFIGTDAAFGTLRTCVYVHVCKTKRES